MTGKKQLQLTSSSGGNNTAPNTPGGNAISNLGGWNFTLPIVPASTPATTTEITKYRRITHHPDGRARESSVYQEEIWQKHELIGPMTDPILWLTAEDVVEHIVGYCESFGGYPPSVDGAIIALDELAEAKLVEKKAQAQW